MFTEVVDQGPQQPWGQRTEEPGPGSGRREEGEKPEPAGGPTGRACLLFSHRTSRFY